MGMKEQILDKVKRNLDILGIAASRNANDVTLEASGCIISYVDSDLKKPMGGIDDQASPYLGIGVANPGQLKMKGEAGDNTIAAIFSADADGQEALRAWALLGNFANDKVLEAGDSASELAFVEGHPDLKNMGQ